MKRLAATLATAALAALLLAPCAQAAFGLNGFDVSFEEEDGSAALQAGSHPYALTTSFGINYTGAGDQALPDGELRDLTIAQVPGLVGDATAIPRCATADFLDVQPGAHCPADTQVGEVKVLFGTPDGSNYLQEPVYNMPPPPGVPARLGFKGLGLVPVFVDVALSQSPPYNLLALSRETRQTLKVFGVRLTVWGVPADHGTGAPELPFITLPTSCEGPQLTSYEASSWSGAKDSGDDGPFDPPALIGCGRLGFGPTISARPSTRAAASASGLDFGLDVADEGLKNPKEGATAASDIRKAVVTLPRGMTADPSFAEGLVGCGEEQFEKRETLDSAPGAGCPEASKIGTIEVESPLIEESLKGDLFVAKPYENPAGSLIALYLVFRNPALGIIVKQVAKVEPDPSSGQLVTTVEEIPQLPFSHFRLHFREGARAPLISPPGCGRFQVAAELYPWSGGAPVESTSAFEIVSGPDNSPCPQGAPFHPGFEAGTINNAAGSYSPFDMRLTRKDGEQDMGRFSFVLPPGVVPKLAGVPYCPEAAIALAKSRTGPHGGQEELGRPACPAASQIGRTVAGAGVGSALTYVPGKLYLAGPYHGDPISAVAITPALAGPFDAGTVVVREALRLNPLTHVGEVDGSASDPIPHILKGIPLNLRDLRVYADRPEFTLNATSCEPFQAQATIWGEGTALAPAPETPVGLSARYQAADCQALGFSPKLAIKLRGGTRRGRFPALKALVTPRPGDANFAKAVVTLPNSAFLEQGHFATICTRVQFAAGAGEGAGCPAASAYGHARAFTPLLAEPLEGPVFLRSSDHNLPDLVVALHGLVDIDLAARIDSIHGGIRTSFTGLPDAPVSRFVLEMQGGKKGLIVNSTNICRGTHRAEANLSGQNGRLERTRPPVRAQGCGKGRRGRRKGR